MAATRLWIVDGHNTVFAIPELQRLQRAGRGEEARRALEERLEEFALQSGDQVLLVFDSTVPGPSPVAATHSQLAVVFARGGADAADKYIVAEAHRRSAAGLIVTVVTNDVRTLAAHLPKAVRRLAVRDFWLAQVEPRPAADDDKPAVGDFADVERQMLALETTREHPNPAWHPDPPAPPSPSPREVRAALLHQKRERNRVRYERRIKRRTAR